MTEKQLVNLIIEFLNYSGECWVWRNNAGNIIKEYKGKKRVIFLGPKGSPDIIGVHRESGRFIGIEVKLPKRRNTLTAYQKDFLNQIGLYSGITGVATTPEEALEIIKEETKDD